MLLEVFALVFKSLASVFAVMFCVKAAMDIERERKQGFWWALLAFFHFVIVYSASGLVA